MHQQNGTYLFCLASKITSDENKSFLGTAQSNNAVLAAFNYVNFCHSGYGVFKLFSFGNRSKDFLI